MEPHFPDEKRQPRIFSGIAIVVTMVRKKRGERVSTCINIAVRGTDSFGAKSNQLQLVLSQHIPAYTGKDVVKLMSHCFKIESVSQCHYWYITRSNLHSCHMKRSRFGQIEKPFALWTDKVLMKTFISGSIRNGSWQKFLTPSRLNSVLQITTARIKKWIW